MTIEFIYLSISILSVNSSSKSPQGASKAVGLLTMHNDDFFVLWKSLLSVHAIKYFPSGTQLINKNLLVGQQVSILDFISGITFLPIYRYQRP
jgi:hypothetical protein